MQHKSIISKFKSFREQLYTCFNCRSDATMELIDSLCTNTTADSVVKLSLNPHFKRGYSSITDVIANFDCTSSEQMRNIRLLLASSVALTETRPFHLIGLDATPAARPFASCMEDRSIVHCPNVIKMNKPITIGHKYSVLGYLPEKSEKKSPPWLLPLSTERIASCNTDIEVGSEQISILMQDIKLPFKNDLTVGVYDSYYSSGAFVEAQYQHKNLISVSRLRSNRVLYCSPPPKEQRVRLKYAGHELWYGKKFKLNDSSTWSQPSAHLSQIYQTHSGKEMNLEIVAWENMLMPGKRTLPMYRYPFTLICIKALGNDGKMLFKRPLWLIVWGERRNELSLNEAYQCYFQRYDMEHFFRFGKNRLLMGKLQTTESKYEESWWVLCSIAYAQLYMARALIDNMPHPWEKYLPNIKANVSIKSPTQVQRSFSKLISQVGTPSKPPKPRGRPLGRKKGYRPVKRKRFLVLIKKKKRGNLVA